MTSLHLPVFVLDDDPTGTQAVRNVPVLLTWNDIGSLRTAGVAARAIHLMTNSRAVDGAAAEAITFAAASQAHRAIPGARIIIRGDSTLRGHVLEEYRALRRAAYASDPPLLLVPALPAAGRVTENGTQWLEQSGRRVPVNTTEYAQDGLFAYKSSSLLEWAEERTGGFLPASAGRTVPLHALRSRGPVAVAETLHEVAAHTPAVCVPDATTIDDLHIIADGLRLAESNGTRVMVRCAPAFAGVLAGTFTDQLIAPPTGRNGVLIVCGSYVSGTTKQLAKLCDTFGIDGVEINARALCSGNADREIDRAAQVVMAQLRERAVALVMTPRKRESELSDIASGSAISNGLAAVVRRLEPLPGTIIAKGGITSQVVVERGLGADRAHVVGPIAPGVALWEVTVCGRKVNYVVFPGNVGGDDSLSEIAAAIIDD